VAIQSLRAVNLSKKFGGFGQPIDRRALGISWVFPPGREVDGMTALAMGARQGNPRCAWLRSGRRAGRRW
jgi:hypothetical protein